MVKFYESDKKTQEFILDFFKLKRKNNKGQSGVRSRVIHNKVGKDSPIIYCAPKRICLTDINRNNFWQQMNIAGELHFRECIYDDEVRNIDVENHEFGWDLEDHRIGISICLDIDAPTEVIGEKEVKVNIFDKAHFEDINKGKCIIENEIEEMDKDFNSMITGNGINVILESDYPDILEKLEGDAESINNFWDVKYATDIRILVEDINLILEEKGIKCRIDDRWKAWSVYHKAPFTHWYQRRFSVPVCKGEMDYDFVNEIIYTDNLFKIDIGSIINKAAWRDIW